MIQISPIALVQAKAGNAFENLLNKIHHFIYPLCREKEVTEKGYNI